MVKTRFAPSPTGYLHVGGLRTALFNFLYAKKHGGIFVLRIEDTDQKRYVPGSEHQIVSGLYWAGVIPDEGVCRKGGQIVEIGDKGPYTQSKRLAIYKKYAEQLLDSGKAYRCFCSPERLEELRLSQQAAKLAPKYDRKCLSLSAEQQKELLKAGQKCVIRFQMPDDGKCLWDDLVFRSMSFEYSGQEDFVILKSDEYPTYNFANVIDDHLMEITHVIRAQEFLSSTPKHIALYDALGWHVPNFCHLSHLVNQDRSKLSKRTGDVSVDIYENRGFLPEATVNFLALLGWNSKDNREIFTMQELIREFDFAKVQKTPAFFDVKKFEWLNGMYIRKMAVEDFIRSAAPFYSAKKFALVGEGRVKNLIGARKFSWSEFAEIMRLEQERVRVFDEVGEETRFFFEDELSYDASMLLWKGMSSENTRKILENLAAYFSEEESDFSASALREGLTAWIKDHSYKTGEVLWPLRVSLSGRERSPDPFQIAAIVGKDWVTKRISHAISIL